MNFHADVLSCSGVEVSGWDAKEDFFVENSEYRNWPEEDLARL
jgi:hypothetical protein